MIPSADPRRWTSSRTLRFCATICTGGVIAYGMIQRDYRAPLGRKVAERPLSSIRILIADDYADWRRLIRLLLQTRPEWQVVAETSDGLEAVRKVEDLKPRLDFAGHRSPEVKWNRSCLADSTTLSQLQNSFPKSEQDRDVVREALSTGALGYVCKIDAEGETTACCGCGSSRRGNLSAAA